MSPPATNDDNNDDNITIEKKKKKTKTTKSNNSNNSRKHVSINTATTCSNSIRYDNTSSSSRTNPNMNNNNWFMVSACNMNQWSLDYDDNMKRIYYSCLLARDIHLSQLRVGSELELCGYGCEDHYYEMDTISHCWESLVLLLKEPYGISDYNFIVDIGMPVIHCGIRYNTRIIVMNREILLIRPKCSLADNGNYRESRYFTAYNDIMNNATATGGDDDVFVLPSIFVNEFQQKTAPFGIKYLRFYPTPSSSSSSSSRSSRSRHNDDMNEDVSRNNKNNINNDHNNNNKCTNNNDVIIIGHETCEELWTPYTHHIRSSLYGVDIICNSSSSYHEISKLDTRLQLTTSTTKKCGGVYIYSNQRGCDGNRNYYDGGSHIICNGQILQLAHQFNINDGYHENHDENHHEENHHHDCCYSSSSSNSNDDDSDDDSDDDDDSEEENVTTNEDDTADDDDDSVRRRYRAARRILRDGCEGGYEVITATIDIDEVRSYRASIPSWGVQAAAYQQSQQQNKNMFIDVQMPFRRTPTQQQQQQQQRRRRRRRRSCRRTRAQTSTTKTSLSNNKEDEEKGEDDEEEGRKRRRKNKRRFLLPIIRPTKPLDMNKIHKYTIEEECCYGPACWLWDYLRRSGACGFFLPLSGGADSTSVAIIVTMMCHMIYDAYIKEPYNGHVARDCRRIIGKTITIHNNSNDRKEEEEEECWIPKSPKEICYHILHTMYMGTCNSSIITTNRALSLSNTIGSYHITMNIDPIVSAMIQIFVLTTKCIPQYTMNGGTYIEDLALQNIQARIRMVIAYLYAQLLPWVRQRRRRRRSSNNKNRYRHHHNNNNNSQNRNNNSSHIKKVHNDDDDDDDDDGGEKSNNNNDKDNSSNNNEKKKETTSSSSSSSSGGGGGGSGGFLLVLGSSNVDEGLRGYMTKYDCSSADLNPIGAISKIDLRRMLLWAAAAQQEEKKHQQQQQQNEEGDDWSIVHEIAMASPTAELRPQQQQQKQEEEAVVDKEEEVEEGDEDNTKKKKKKKDNSNDDDDAIDDDDDNNNNNNNHDNKKASSKGGGNHNDDNKEHSQLDEEEMGMTYEELSVFGKLRKIYRCGPVSMFKKLLLEWDHISVTEVAKKVQRFFYYYSMNRHKMCTITPSYHAEQYSPDDNRFDQRPFLYNTKWTRQFHIIDTIAKQYNNNNEQQQQEQDEHDDEDEEY